CQILSTRAQKAAVDRADINMFFTKNSIWLQGSLSVCKGSYGDVFLDHFQSNPLHEFATCP
ncbi:MAG: hypothetical protein ABSE57_29395, partial [Bryobacteraceae bacterium]